MFRYCISRQSTWWTLVKRLKLLSVRATSYDVTIQIKALCLYLHMVLFVFSKFHKMKFSWEIWLILINRSRQKGRRREWLVQCTFLFMFSPLFIDVNECLSSPCDANANCQNTIGSFQCSCNAGFTGDGITCSGISKEIVCYKNRPSPYSWAQSHQEEEGGCGKSTKFCVLYRIQGGSSLPL